jgi:hypothetical protein
MLKRTMGGTSPYTDVRVAESDELPNMPMPPTVKVERDPVTGKFLPRNGIAKGIKKKLLRPEVMGRGYAADKTMAKFLVWANAYSKARRLELATMCGGTLSAGASSLIETASLALANSRYMQFIGSGGNGKEPNPELLLKSSRLADQARQSELAAYELAVREYKARPKVEIRVNPFAASSTTTALAANPVITSKELNRNNTATIPPEPGATYLHTSTGQVITIKGDD